jgi:transcriptional regulator with AAA-type ATPase domain/pSer/pThr/pTyr-binding forkhead associated (FHA) protein
MILVYRICRFFYNCFVNYLMYVQSGVIKKFALTKPEIFIGRDSQCDIVLANPEISKIHCRVEVFSDHIHIIDQKSKNGIFIDRSRITEARIMLNNSFGIHDVEFYFKKGDVKEFAISRELSGIISTLTRSKRQRESGRTKTHDGETKDAENKFSRLLPSLVEKAILTDDFKQFIRCLRQLLDGILPLCSLFLFHQGREILIFDFLDVAPYASKLTKATLASGGIGQLGNSNKSRYFRRFHHKASDDFLLFCSDDPRMFQRSALIDFLDKLLEIIIFNLRLVPAISFDPTPVPVLFNQGGILIVSQDPGMKRLLDIVAKIAAKTTFILIMGESGTGKELFARMIHLLSGRRRFEAINCAAIPATLLESELFGYEAGAFTDARKSKAGKIEVASGGTLVLDEIGDMPLEVQAKLLRVIQERSVTRLGNNEPIPVDIRLIAMTNHDLYQLVREKKFRQDLFFRLRVHELTIPPLRDRREDIPALVLHFGKIYAARNGVEPAGFSESVFDCFKSYAWPGNVRELENEIMRIMEIIDDHELIGDQHLIPSIVAACREERPAAPSSSLPYHEKIAQFEHDELLWLLKAKNGNKSSVARSIGITYQGLLKKLKKLGIE